MTLRTGIAVLVLFPAEGVGPRQALQGLAKLPRRPAGLRARALNSETELQFLIIYFDDLLFFPLNVTFSFSTQHSTGVIPYFWLEASVQTSFRIPRHIGEKLFIVLRWSKNTRVVGGLVLPNSCEALYLRQGDALSSTTTPFVSLQLSISSSKSGSSSTPSLGCSSKWRILCCEPAFEILLSLCIRSPNTNFQIFWTHTDH